MLPCPGGPDVDLRATVAYRCSGSFIPVPAQTLSDRRINRPRLSFPWRRTLGGRLFGRAPRTRGGHREETQEEAVSGQTYEEAKDFVSNMFVRIRSGLLTRSSDHLSDTDSENGASGSEAENENPYPLEGKYVDEDDREK